MTADSCTDTGMRMHTDLCIDMCLDKCMDTCMDMDFDIPVGMWMKLFFAVT